MVILEIAVKQILISVLQTLVSMAHVMYVKKLLVNVQSIHYVYIRYCSEHNT